MSSTTPATPNNNYQMENKVAESTPMSPQTYPSQTQPQPPPMAFQDAQGQYQQPPMQPQQPGYPPQGQPYQQPQSPYQQQPAYAPPQDQQNFGQYPPQQQQPYQQPIQSTQPISPQMTGQSQPVSTVYSSELDGHNQYQAPAAVSPPPQQYQQPYPSQH